MTTKKLPPNAGMGRIKGVPNKATLNARRAIAAFVKKNEPRLDRLLDEIEKREGPRAAYECVMRLIEHHMPRKPPGPGQPVEMNGDSPPAN